MVNMPPIKRHNCETCRYSFILDNGKEYRCIKTRKVYDLNEIYRRLCTGWKEPGRETKKK